MKQKRTSWIDVARGIGIILVVYGHALSADSLRFLIYSFHMPLFFLLSGLVFTYRPEQNVVAFLIKNTRSLLYPYGIFALISFVLWIMTREVSEAEAWRQFWSIFYGNGNDNLLAFNNLLWFLPCLFITRLGFFTINKLTTKKEQIVILLFLSSLVGYLFSFLLPTLKLFFGIETALTAIVFLGGGFLLKTILQKLNDRKRHILLAFFITAGLCLLFAVVNYQEYGTQIDLRQNRLNNYIYFYLAAFSGTIATLMVSMVIRVNRVLEYIGRNSLIIFVWHLIMFSYITKFLAFTHLRGLLATFPSFFSPIFYSIFSIIAILIIAFGLQYLFVRSRVILGKLTT